MIQKTLLKDNLHKAFELQKNFPSCQKGLKLLLAICVTAVLMVLLLTGCSGQNTKTQTVSEAFSSQDRQIWYAIRDPIGKDTLIEALYVVEDGVVDIYDLSHAKTMTLGNASKHDSEGVADAIIGWYNDELNSAEGFERELLEEGITKNVKANFTLNTDKTGNKVDTEKIIFGDGKKSYTCQTVRDNTGGDVYDAVWSGFNIIANTSSDGMGHYLLQMNPDVKTVLDPIKSPNVEVR